MKSTEKDFIKGLWTSRFSRLYWIARIDLTSHSFFRSLCLLPSHLLRKQGFISPDDENMKACSCRWWMTCLKNDAQTLTQKKEIEVFGVKVYPFWLFVRIHSLPFVHYFSLGRSTLSSRETHVFDSWFACLSSVRPSIEMSLMSSFDRLCHESWTLDTRYRGWEETLDWCRGSWMFNSHPLHLCIHF